MACSRKELSFITYFRNAYWQVIAVLIFMSVMVLITTWVFTPVLRADEIVVDLGFTTFDICSKFPDFWEFLKFSFLIISGIVYFGLGSNINFAIRKKVKAIIKERIRHEQELNLANAEDAPLRLTIGKDEDGSFVFIPESGLYQNFLVTGTIGSGKTSSAMYPFTRRLIEYSTFCEKIGMLILDVKGNYSSYVTSVCNEFEVAEDLVVISLGTDVFYNPLDKPNLKPQVLANRLKTILLLFSENNGDSFWLDKAEEVLCECIKLCRLYNDGYVTFLEIHKLIFHPGYYKKKLDIMRERFVKGELSKREVFNLNSCVSFFQKDFEKLDQRTLAILKSEIGRITNTFVSDYDVLRTFSPPRDKISFNGFSEVIKKGKIVVLSMNIAEYRNLAMMIAAYLKLDFQTEVLANLSSGEVHRCAFICDEYDKYASKIDGEFFSLSREAKCINIVSTQSFSSLKNILKDDSAVNVIIQNLINKSWFRTDDVFTIEESQKLLGREDKEIVTRSVSESAKETKYNFFTGKFHSESPNISESYSTHSQKDFAFDFNFFSQDLETFQALCFLSDGQRILKPQKIEMIPYFK